jgi:hypothetical protein
MPVAVAAVAKTVIGIAAHILAAAAAPRAIIEAVLSLPSQNRTSLSTNKMATHVEPGAVLHPLQVHVQHRAGATTVELLLGRVPVRK